MEDNKMFSKCKHCEQPKYKCPCDKVDRLFTDNWHLMYTKQGEYMYAVAVEKSDRLKRSMTE